MARTTKRAQPVQDVSNLGMEEPTMTLTDILSNVQTLPKGSMPKPPRAASAGRPADPKVDEAGALVRHTYETQTDAYQDVDGTRAKEAISLIRRGAAKVGLGVSVVVEDPFSPGTFIKVGKDTEFPETVRVWFSGQEKRTYNPRQPEAKTEE